MRVIYDHPTPGPVIFQQGDSATLKFGRPTKRIWFLQFFNSVFDDIERNAGAPVQCFWRVVNNAFAIGQNDELLEHNHRFPICSERAVV